MAYRDRALLIDSIGNNWSQSNSTAAGTTLAVSSPAPAAKERIHLTQLGWSIRNNGAAAYTATINVRHASIAGTVIASWDVQPAAAGSLQDSWVVNLVGKKGIPVFVEFGTPASGVTQKLSIGGWRDTLSDG